MNRRDVLKSIGGITALTELGLAPTYVTAQDTVGVDVVILKCPGPLSLEQIELFKDQWEAGMKGTVLEHVRAVVLTSGMSVELLRGRQP
jgi:hypothetical protein